MPPHVHEWSAAQADRPDGDPKSRVGLQQPSVAIQPAHAPKRNTHMLHLSHRRNPTNNHWTDPTPGLQNTQQSSAGSHERPPDQSNAGLIGTARDRSNAGSNGTAPDRSNAGSNGTAPRQSGSGLRENTTGPIRRRAPAKHHQTNQAPGSGKTPPDQSGAGLRQNTTGPVRRRAPAEHHGTDQAPGSGRTPRDRSGADPRKNTTGTIRRRAPANAAGTIGRRAPAKQHRSDQAPGYNDARPLSMRGGSPVLATRRCCNNGSRWARLQCVGVANLYLHLGVGWRDLRTREIALPALGRARTVQRLRDARCRGHSNAAHARRPVPRGPRQRGSRPRPRVPRPWATFPRGKRTRGPTCTRREARRSPREVAGVDIG